VPNDAHHPEQFTRYAPFYRFLLDLDVPIEVVSRGTKQIAHLTAPLSRLRSLHHIEAALDWADQSLGAVTHQEAMPGVNKNGLANLDIDHDGLDFDLSPFRLMIRRTGETSRAQYLFRVAQPEAQLHCTQHGTHDVCTWLFMLPGSIHKSGSLYELWIKEDGEWVPWDGQPLSLDLLPILDPDAFRITFSDAELIALGIDPASLPGRRTKGHRKGKRRTATLVWVTATGQPSTRLKKAKYYLIHRAWQSVSGCRGHISLLVAVANLRLYFQLSKELSLKLLKDHFNPRCKDLNGCPEPWSDKELEHKWKQAGKPGMFPTLGVKDERAVNKVKAAALRDEVKRFLAEFTVEGGSSSPTLLREAFLVWRGGEDVNGTAFGLAVQRASGVKSTKPGGVRAYHGFSLSSAGLRLITHGLPMMDAAT
jgi:hypothetical protein